MKILVLPDIHGRKFWKVPCENINDYDKVIFLGDYMDPYPFEGNEVPESLENFKDIVKFANENKEKVVLLLGNHDMGYFSDEYYKMDSYHCRHSKHYHDDIAKVFDDNRDLFKIAHTEDGILFTHAGCVSGWIDFTFTKGYKLTSLDDFVFSLNNLVNTKDGLGFLFMVSSERGGYDRDGSCIWADVNEVRYDRQMMSSKPYHFIREVKQVFGHTLQAFYGKDGKIEYGDAVVGDNFMMLDNAHAYVLDTEKFDIETV